MSLFTQKALFALGNFWNPEYAFNKLPGVTQTTVGYTGGKSENPTYHNIGDHSEAILINFDPNRITYLDLLNEFWKLHDPTAAYETRFRSAIFYFDETQREQAERSMQVHQASYRDPILTQINPVGLFYKAEPHNQHYLAKLRREI